VDLKGVKADSVQKAFESHFPPPGVLNEEIDRFERAKATGKRGLHPIHWNCAWLASLGW
jgi:hypothetical protein